MTNEHHSISLADAVALAQMTVELECLRTYVKALGEWEKLQPLINEAKLKATDAIMARYK